MKKFRCQQITESLKRNDLVDWPTLWAALIEDLHEINDSVEKKLHRKRIEKKTGKCGLCPLHDGENRRKRQRSDKYKDKR